MKLTPTPIAGCYRGALEVIGDARGSFTSVFELDGLRAAVPGFAIHRANRSWTKIKGAIRGLHFQRDPESEAKLIQCVRGKIFDVCVDLRPESATYLEWTASELGAENQQLLLVPRGCAHGFQTLEDDSVVEYFCDGRYSPPHEGGLRWDDPALGIRWPLPCTLTSSRDAAWPLLEGAGR